MVSRTPSSMSEGSGRTDDSPAIHQLRPRALWDCIQARTDDGEYTTLRHATLGIAVELWHDSMGAFHLYIPATGTGRTSVPGAVFCCFSSGIVVPEDAVNAPELLLTLCERSSSFDAAGPGAQSRWVRDAELCLPVHDIEISNGSGDRSWSIAVDGASRLVDGRQAHNALVITHALTNSEIVLFYGGLIFSVDEPLLLPSMSGIPNIGHEVSLDGAVDEEDDVAAMLLVGRLSRAHYSANVSKFPPSDPVQIRGSERNTSFSISSSWLLTDPRAPAQDVKIRERLSHASLSSAHGRQRMERWRDQQPLPPGPLRPRFCGASSRWGDHAGLISVSGLERQLPESGHGSGQRGPAPSLPGRDGGGRAFMHSFLERTYLGTGRDRRPRVEGQAGARELQWCRRTAANPEASDDELRDLLMAIARNGWDEFLDPQSPWLVAAGESAVASMVDGVDDVGSSALMIACFHGHVDLAKSLVQRGANPNLSNDRGRTCLFHALSLPPKPASDKGREESYDVAAQRKYHVALSLVDLLLSAGAHADHADNKGVTPLKLAATSGYQQCAAMLMRAGADPTRRDLAGATVIESIKALLHQETSVREKARLQQMLGVLQGTPDWLASPGPSESLGAGAQAMTPLMRRRTVRDLERRRDVGHEVAEEDEDGAPDGDGRGASCILVIGGKGAQVRAALPVANLALCMPAWDST